MGQALGCLWPAPLLPNRHGDLRPRFGSIRTVSQHDRAHCLPGDPGARRRRDDSDSTGHSWRYLPSGAARSLDRLSDEHLWFRNHHRSLAGRLDHRQPGLALDLLRQRSGWSYCHRLRGGCPAGTCHVAQTLHRLFGVHTPGGIHGAAVVGLQPGRGQLRLGVTDDRRTDQR